MLNSTSIMDMRRPVTSMEETCRSSTTTINVMGRKETHTRINLRIQMRYTARRCHPNFGHKRLSNLISYSTNKKLTARSCGLRFSAFPPAPKLLQNLCAKIMTSSANLTHISCVPFLPPNADLDSFYSKQY